MTKKIRIVLAQLNLIVGDIDYNLEKHISSAKYARNELGADLIVFPELSLTGYPPEDLLLRKNFIRTVNDALRTLMQEITDIHCLLGYPHPSHDGLQNTCSILYAGNIIASYAKHHLPNYGVFDEKRYFVPGQQPCVFPLHDIPIGVIICEDLWEKQPINAAKAAGARLIIVPNASPFEIEKHQRRMQILNKQIKEAELPIIYVNQIGGQDELIFDGGSSVINHQGEICQFAGFFTEKLLPVDINVSPNKIDCTNTTVQLPSRLAMIYEGLVLSLKDYLNKNQIPGVILGLSGGIDSALTLTLAVDALGKDKVQTVMMPSPHTSELSLTEAKKIAENLAVKYDIIPITAAYQLLLDTVSPHFANSKPDITEENIQARLRAIILMALSNKSGRLVLVTGNHSEMAVGYSTLYGDLAGGFAVLKNVSKTLVYELAHYRNTISPVIPLTTINRAPTAELAANQYDEASLAPYTILDKVIDAYTKEEKSIEEIIRAGFDAALVIRIVNLIRKNEYKRRQAPMGPHLELHSFGKDWRYPLTNGFKG